MEYPFITITPKLHLTLRSLTDLGPHLGVKKLWLKIVRIR